MFSQLAQRQRRHEIKRQAALPPCFSTRILAEARARVAAAGSGSHVCAEPPGAADIARGPNSASEVCAPSVATQRAATKPAEHQGLCFASKAVHTSP